MDDYTTIYKKVCKKENCTNEVKDHLYYDTTLCEICAYDDEVNNHPREVLSDYDSSKPSAKV